MRTALVTGAAVLAVFAVGGGATARTDTAARKACTKYAAPGGSDGSRGSRRRPFRTPQRLVGALRAGQTGCLRQGVYSGRLRIRRQGRPGAPITLRSAPGESARFIGRVVVTRRAAHVVVRQLYLDGRNPGREPSPTIAGHHVVFASNDVTNANTGICFALGHRRYGIAEDVVLRSNRIHNCGRLPATNHDHGVYVSIARRTRVVANWIYANADRGVQLFPDAQNSYVAGNVIDGNGEGLIFGGDLLSASSGNVVEGNVLSGSTIRHNVESFYPPGGAIGSGNVVRRNCISGGARSAGGGVIDPVVGFLLQPDNLLLAPQFRALARRDYRFGARTPCAGLFAGKPRSVPGPRRRPPRGFRLSG